MMKIVKVMVHVESDCPKCGGKVIRMGLADVTPDGRIGAATYTAADKCDVCEKAERDAEARESLAALQRTKWAQGAPPMKFRPRPTIGR